MGKDNLAIFISGRGSNMQALARACFNGEVNANVVLVLSDNPEAQGLVWAKENGIPTEVVDYLSIMREAKEKGLEFELPEGFELSTIKETAGTGFEGKPFWWFFGRARAEAEIYQLLLKYEVTVAALAGFEKLLTPYFHQLFQPDLDIPRVLNIHPALLPSFPGQHGYEDTFNSGNRWGGITVHYVDCGEDTGPVIDQDVYPIRREWGDTLEIINRRGLELEWKLYPKCIQLHISGQLKVVENESGIRIVERLAEIHNHPKTM